MGVGVDTDRPRSSRGRLGWTTVAKRVTKVVQGGTGWLRRMQGKDNGELGWSRWGKVVIQSGPEEDECRIGCSRMIKRRIRVD